MRRILLAALLGLAGAVAVQEPVRADTMQFHGVNWADQRDNFVNGVLYVSGLGSGDTYASASVVADRVVGQLLRYMNWVRKELAEPGQRVRGVIVCRSISEDLILACSGINGIELFEYRLKVTVSKVPLLDFS
jgi:hypothetical protein